ncbi:GntR family transcriptional regulator, transcriptional repressor for pyruvate dehydrogenase complex [Actinopolyspora mzabensis]|uniref:GntR family transcriptional regulator, transcriptional repressor for pyruvate dehydrogenase complex n=1 Tax=Actinopolyspora mzabensis TaxID=995066 RepID=A0A1G9CWG3_ACTMZ|nr:FadR/GntR family transcriptional regulator [Actinopolyspora mzabensis]SDK55764.1 GntR family transcriptional regulator, transcriptional repressor for pyruvate dehydrogenase complex [Actinopolyspora mzabensis]
MSETDEPERPANRDAATELEELIFERFGVGELLPSESELATRLGVSRLTVREAIRSLQARGLVEIRKGRRPRVTAPSGDQIGDFFNILLRWNPGSAFELLEVRHGLEVQTSTLAANNAGSSDVSAMELAIRAMERAEDAAEYHDADLRFHELLARASGNRMLALLIEALAGSLRDSMIASYRGHRKLGGAHTDAAEQHREVLDRVRQHDPGGAAEAMRRHLRTTERDLRAVFNTAPTGDTANERRDQEF